MTEMVFGISTHTVLNLVVLTFLVVVAGAIIKMSDMLAAAMLSGIFSLLMALMYLILEAPDVAITEAAVGAGISTIMLLATLVFTGREEACVNKHALPGLIVVTVVGASLIYATSDMPHFGDDAAPANRHVAPYYIQQMKPEIGIPNIVTGVLASYRAWDTFGEVIVVFTALTAVLLLLSPRRGGQSRRKEKPDA